MNPFLQLFFRRKLAIAIIIVIVALTPLWHALVISYRGGRPFGTLSLIDEHYNRTMTKYAKGHWRIVFISCNRQRMYNPFWDIINRIKPHGLIWMGDNIYADHTGSQLHVMKYVMRQFLKKPIKTLLSLTTRSEVIFPPATPQIIEEEYARVVTNPTYNSIVSQLQFLTGTWDDHDYGINDGDKTYPYKNASKTLLLNFLNVPQNDSRRHNDHQGVYTHQTFTLYSPIKHQPYEISFIILDTRYNKDPWTVHSNTGDFLGEQQWNWLENILETTSSDINILVSSIQVLPEKRRATESWDGFPNARKRFLDLIIQYKVHNPVFLTGDVHLAEISTQLYSMNNLNTSLSVLLWEFTSSGLTHATRRVPFGFGLCMDLMLRWILPTPNVDVAPNGYKQIYTGRNMGVFDVFWDNDVPIFEFKMINSKSEIVLQRTLIAGVNSEKWWFTPFNTDI